MSCRLSSIHNVTVPVTRCLISCVLSLVQSPYRSTDIHSKQRVSSCDCFTGKSIASLVVCQFDSPTVCVNMVLLLCVSIWFSYCVSIWFSYCVCRHGSPTTENGSQGKLWQPIICCCSQKRDEQLTTNHPVL